MPAPQGVSCAVFQAKSVLAAARRRRHRGGMAVRNVFAIAGIIIFLMAGVVVALGVVATVLIFLYGIVVLVFSGAIGIELPRLF